MVQVRWVILLTLFGWKGVSFSQIGNNVFNDQILHKIELTTPLEDWQAVLSEDFLNHQENPAVYPEVYRPCLMRFDGAYVVNCGFRERGNSSRNINENEPKKPLKIAMDAFVEQSYNGVQKFNLQNFTHDPSLVHDALAYSLFRELGIPAPRTAYAQLYVNGEYMGLYLMVENVDKTFLKIHFGSENNDGNLYKTDKGAALYLNDLGNDPSPYIGAGLKLTTNEQESDYSQIIDFIHFLNQPQRLDFNEELEKRFDIENYLKILAVEKFIRSWDNYWAGGNNFYLYEHPDGQYRWIPWDMNETFQDMRNLSWTTWLDGYWVPIKQMEERPLIAAIFRNDRWKNQYIQLGCELIQDNFTIQNISGRVVFWHNLVAEAYREDPHKINSYDDFEKSLTEQHTNQIQIQGTPYALRFHYPGLFPLLQEQREWVSDQLKGWELDCPLHEDAFHLQPFPNPGSSYCRITLPQNQIGQIGLWKVVNAQGVVVQSFPWMIAVEEQFTFTTEEWSDGVYFILFEGIDGSKGLGKWMCHQEN